MATARAKSAGGASAEVKAERERDKVEAMRDYETEQAARYANMERLRNLRLAKEAAEAKAAPKKKPAPAKTATRSRRAGSGSA